MRKAFQGTGKFPVISACFALVGTVFLVLVLMNTSGLLWIGHEVHASERGGIVYYTYKGASYSINDPGNYRTGSRTIWIDPGKPSRVAFDGWVPRVSESLVVGGPYLAAAALGIGAVVRKRRYVRTRRRIESQESDNFGDGLDRDTVERLLARQRADARGGPPSSPFAPR